MSEKQELQKRFDAERKHIEALIANLEANAEAKKNDTVDAAKGTVDELRGKLDEMKKAVADGWESVTEEGARRLNALLERVRSSQNEEDDRDRR